MFLTNGSNLLENKCQRATETRLQELTVITVLASDACTEEVLAWLPPHLCFRSQVGLLSALSHIMLGTSCELIAIQPRELSLKCRPGNDRYVLGTRISQQDFEISLMTSLTLSRLMVSTPVGPVRTDRQTDRTSGMNSQ